MDGEIDIIIIQCVVKSLALAVGSIKLYRERKNIMKRNEEKIFDIIIFLWEDWDEIDTGYLQFYNVEFPFESMKKYNGLDVSLNMNGEMSITSNDEEVWKGFSIDIPEFLEEMKKKVKNK